MPRSEREVQFPAWVTIAILLFGILIVAIEWHSDAECRDRGGVPLWTRGQVVCLSTGVTR